MDVVDLPDPPFSLPTTMICAKPNPRQQRCAEWGAVTV
jgi:hypothetical protein